MKSISFTIVNRLVKPFLKLYLKSDSSVRYDGFKLKILKGVFHPKLFFSTTYFYDFISFLDLKNKKVLEIGCGSGVLSLLAFKKGALITAIDIDKKAIENTKLNFSNNFLNFDYNLIIESNVFDNLPQQQFDIIFINPPYYFKKIQSNTQLAWYCGEHGEYFEKLFLDLKNYFSKNGFAYMILEEKAEIERIKNIAKKNGIYFEEMERKKIIWEWNSIFKLYYKAE